jgi:hypothetical protein
MNQYYRHTARDAAVGFVCAVTTTTLNLISPVKLNQGFYGFLEVFRLVSALHRNLSSDDLPISRQRRRKYHLQNEPYRSKVAHAQAP